jgi:hypothetical protein
MISDVAAAVKAKQKVLGFKLDDKTICVWFHRWLLKKKARNNFGSIQCKQRQVQAVPEKSQRVAA